MSKTIVTNNKAVYEKYKGEIEIIYKEDSDMLDILKFVRDKIHKGHRLKTHPLSGSIKPNETPYKTIIISKNKGELDQDSLRIIEESILNVKKFISIKPTPNWNKRVLNDFKVIDLSLIENAIGLGR